MKRYKLLKDLPFAKAGTIFRRMSFKSKDGLSDYDYLETNVLLDGNQDETVFSIKRNYFVNNFDEWFEEVGEPEWVYYVDSFGSKVSKIRVSHISRIRENLKSIGNYFETEEEAEEYLKYIKAKAVIKESANEFKPDWNNHSQRKFYGAWVVEARRPCLCSDDELQHRTIYFKTGEALLKSFDNHPDEWKTYLTYEQQG